MGNELPQQRMTTGVGVGYTCRKDTKFGFSLPTFIKNKNDFFQVYVMNLSHEVQLPIKKVLQL